MTDQPKMSFATQNDWRKWLSENWDKSNGVWIKILKKGSETPSIQPLEALEEALCYGWIDGQRKGLDEKSYLQKYTPRRLKSMWSKINTENAARLINSGKMTPAGLAEIEKAKADGRWDRAYESPKNTRAPEDFLKELSKNKKAQDFYATLNKTNTFAISWRINQAKRAETREARIKKFVEMLSHNKKLY